MDKIEKFFDYINEKTCNKFEFLRLKQVFFDVSKNSLSITLLYPSQIALSEQDKEEIKNAIKAYINLEIKFEIEILKSYIEEDLVRKQIKVYLDKNHKMLSTLLLPADIKIDCEKEKITFFLDEQFLDYFYSANLSKGLFGYLSHVFCANFEIDAESKGKAQTNSEALKKRVDALMEESQLSLIRKANENRFVVENKQVIVGKEITHNPRKIKSIDRCYDDCVLAGDISFLTEKTYTSKRTKKNKDGEEEPIIKPFFRFQIKDSTASINCVIFPSKENYHKMHLLKNGDKVVLQGKISKYNDIYEIMAKNISLCSIPSSDEVLPIQNEESIVAYKYVTPRPFESQRQANLFEESSYSYEAKNQNYVVYDFETTGIDPNNDEIIEIGALKIEKGKFSEVFSTLVRPKKLIPPEATKVNRITNEMVKDAYSIEQILPDFYLFCKDCQMVGYNSIAFDYLFLDSAAKKIGIKFSNTQLDAFLLAKQKIKDIFNYKLASVAKYLDVNLIGAHRALNDVIATAEVFLKLY